MKRKIEWMLFLFIIGGILGCITNPILPYSSTSGNIMRIKKSGAGGYKINIGTFTATQQGIKGFQCRMEGTSAIPNGMTVEQYIENAFKEDFMLADLYSADAKQVLTGNIELVDVKTPVGEGQWTLKVVYSINNKVLFTVDSTYKFPSHFHAGLACKDTASAFVPAVQQLILQTSEHPEFIRALRKK